MSLSPEAGSVVLAFSSFLISPHNCHRFYALFSAQKWGAAMRRSFYSPAQLAATILILVGTGTAGGEGCARVHSQEHTKVKASPMCMPKNIPPMCIAQEKKPACTSPPKVHHPHIPKSHLTPTHLNKSPTGVWRD